MHGAKRVAKADAVYFLDDTFQIKPASETNAEPIARRGRLWPPSTG
jgi:hypothetical protein